MNIFRAIFIALLCVNLYSQKNYSPISITKTFSSNGKYRIESTPFDNFDPSLRGKSLVFDGNNLKYSINRPFIRLGNENYLAISNNGVYVFYIMSQHSDSENDELKNITVYQNGILIKTFTTKEFSGFDPDREDGLLLYDNVANIIDYEKSNFNDKPIVVFKEDITPEELFLSKNPAFTLGDTIYCTNSKRITTVFDLNTQKIVEQLEFSKLYPRLNLKNYKILTEYKTYIPPKPEDSYFPNLKNGKKTAIALAEELGLKAIYPDERDDGIYHYFKIDIEGLIDQNGNLEILKLNVDKKLPHDKIKNFLENQIYDVSFLPIEFDKFFYHYFFWKFRNADNQMAMNDTKEYELEYQLEEEQRKTADTIGGFYIPKNLKDCFVHLDKILSNKTKRQILESEDLSMLNAHGSGFGMSIRNNWGINGGSRLSAYFNQRGITSRDYMSGIIIDGYSDWLKNVSNVAEDWERKNPVKN